MLDAGPSVFGTQSYPMRLIERILGRKAIATKAIIEAFLCLCGVHVLHSNGVRMCSKVGASLHFFREETKLIPFSHHNGRMRQFIVLAFRKANSHQTCAKLTAHSYIIRMKQTNAIRDYLLKFQYICPL